jgi:cobalt-zinc-cadmium efflux system outer membrane protein
LLDSVGSFEALTAKLEQNPDFLRFASESRLRDAELRLERAQSRPNLTLGVGVRRLGESGDAALVAGFSMPLQFYDRNQGRIREAELRREQTDAGKEAALVRVRAVLHSLYRELGATRARFETLRADALPFAQQALEQTQYGYERGRFSYLELATAQQELLGLRVAVIDAAADFHRVLAEVERLTGEPLASDRNQQEKP